MAGQTEKVAEFRDGSEKDAPKNTGMDPKKKIIILLLPIFLVIATVVGIYFSGIADTFFSEYGPGAPQGEAHSSAPADGEKKAPAPPPQETKPRDVFFDVPEMVVNLATKPPQKPVYFKVKVVLELSAPTDRPIVEELMPRIVDSMQFYLREMRAEELQGPAGTYRLKEEIVGRLNKVTAPAKIKDVLFKDILIQ